MPLVDLPQPSFFQKADPKRIAAIVEFLSHDMAIKYPAVRQVLGIYDQDQTSVLEEMLLENTREMDITRAADIIFRDCIP